MLQLTHNNYIDYVFKNVICSLTYERGRERREEKKKSIYVYGKIKEQRGSNVLERRVEI